MFGSKSKKDLLLDAVRNNNIQDVKKAMDEKANINAKDNNGNTALHLVNDLEILRLLIDAEADVNIPNKDGKIPLHTASKPEIEKLLITAGSKVNAQTNTKDTALHLVDNPFTTQLLIEAGADVNAKNDVGNTPLHEVEDLDIAKLLISAGAKVNALNNLGETPLLVAANAQIEQLLIDSDASLVDVSDKGRSIMHSAFLHTTLLKALKQGVNVNRADYLGNTPLDYAKTSDIEEILIEAGAKISPIVKDSKTILHTAKSAKTVALAVQIGINVNKPDKDGNTALHYADNKKLAKALIDFEANLNAKNNLGETPLFYTQKTDVAQALLEAGADANAVSDSHCLLNYSLSKEKDPYFIKLLLFYGANPNSTDPKVGSPLSLCKLRKEYYSLLLGAGADLHIQNADLTTALEALKDELHAHQQRKYDPDYHPSITDEDIKYIQDLILNPKPILEKEIHNFNAQKEEYFMQIKENAKKESSTEKNINNSQDKIETEKKENTESKTSNAGSLLTESPKSTKNSNNSGAKDELLLHEIYYLEETLKELKVLHALSDEELFWKEVKNKEYFRIPKLIEFGFKEELNRRYNANLPLLQVLLEQKEIFWAKKILEAGANPDARDCEGNTALHKAVSENADITIIKLLLFYNASLKAKNDEGLNAYEIALQKQDLTEKEVVLKLLKFNYFSFSRAK